jgi:RsiW-degrading membrane proteinase PrsW (M82 family)
MNIATAKHRIKINARRNRPWTWALGLAFGVAAIYTDYYLNIARRATAQEAMWFLCALGLLVIGLWRTLHRKQLLIPFVLTLIIHILAIYSMRSFFPLDNSLLVILFWAPETVLLFFVFACFARLLDPFGARPD